MFNDIFRNLFERTQMQTDLNLKRPRSVQGFMCELMLEEKFSL